MFKLSGWGCVLTAVALAVSTQAAPQAGSAQRDVRSLRPTSGRVSEQPVGDESTATKLPVRRVILYKTGVGYFEHVGRVQDDETVRIDFTSGQLNDVLQSLTILDLNGGRIAGVNYNSEASVGQRLGALHLPLEETTDLTKFYAALRGARLEVASGPSVFTGRLLSIESKTRVASGTTVDVDLLTLVSDSGEVRNIEMTPAVRVRLAEREVNAEVARYLALLSSTRQQDIRRLTIDTTGTGRRELYVSYISEVPVWKTTYRIVLPSKPGDQPLLQGWAIVDNTVGEDWNDVELSLVAGAPQSFVEDLSQPYYASRPVIPVPEMAQLAPQTHQSAMVEGNLGAKIGSQAETVTFVAALSPGPETATAGASGGNLGSTRELGGGSGKGSGLSPGKGWNVGVGVPNTNLVNSVRATAQAGAQGADLGDLFEYKLKDRVTIHKNESALVPIVQEHVSAERVSLWNPGLGSSRPLRALWLTNSSNLTLDQGSFSVLENEAFAGEGLTDSVKPGEKRLVSYAADLGARVEMASASDPQHFTRVRIDRGVMTQTCETREETTYTIRDDDTTPRTIVIEHPLRSGWLLSEDGPQPVEATAGVYRFRVAVEPKATKIVVVREKKPVETTYQLTELDGDEIALLVRQRSINSEIEGAFRKIVDQKGRVAALEDQVSERDDQTKKIYDDQARLRENLKALKGGPEERALVERYTKQLDDQESRLQQLERESADLETRRRQAQDQLDEMIESLSLDVTI
jgi:hypothetical protein